MKYLAAGVYILFTALLILVVQGEGKTAEPPVFNLLYPSDKTVFIGAGLSHVIVELNRPANLSVRLNGKLQ